METLNVTEVSNGTLDANTQMNTINEWHPSGFKEKNTLCFAPKNE